MMINEHKDKPAMKELKVNIPVRYHLQLHTLKVMEGRQIHGVIKEALDHYFASLKSDSDTTEADERAQIAPRIRAR